MTIMMKDQAAQEAACRAKFIALQMGLGNPVDFILTGGEVHDSLCADALLDGKTADFVLADKAYDSDKILDKIAQMDAVAVIPPKFNRREQCDYDKHYYKDRNLIERFFVD